MAASEDDDGSGPPVFPSSWKLCDCYCGLGGFTAGALDAFRAAGVSGVEVVGIDSDKTPLELFKQNCARSEVAKGVVGSVRTVCRTIGKDSVDWPDEDGRLVIHWSPCCQPFSKARAASPASASSVESGIDQMKTILDLIVSKRYRRWSLEEVAHPQIVELLRQRQALHPRRIAFDVIDAVSYGCPSERRRLIACDPSVMKDLKSRTTIDFVTPAIALRAADISPPSDFYRNGNASCAPRPISRPSFTVTASHPLVFCKQDSSLVRCMTPSESAALVGLPPSWRLPSSVGAAQRSVGNVVAPPVAAAIVASALAMEEEEEEQQQPDASGTSGTSGEWATRAEVEAMVSALRAEVHTLLRKRARSER